MNLRCAGLILVSLLAGQLLSAQSAPAGAKSIAKTKQTAKQRQIDEMSKGLLLRAYGLSKQVSEQDRAYLLGRLASASSKKQKDQSLAWADETFQSTAALPHNMVRNQSERAAIMAIADNDPDHALQLLADMEAPESPSGGEGPPDMHNGIAAMLFQRYWQKKGIEGLDKLQSAARRLGETGNYPFIAMGPLARQVSRKNKERAAAIVNEALSFLNQRPQTGMASEQLAMFLRMNRDLIPTAIMKETLELLVKEALEAKDSNGLQVSATFEDDKGNKAELTKASSLLLFHLMPMIKDIDSEWAKKLEKDHEELRQAAQFQATETRMFVGVRNGNGENGPPPDMREEMTSMRVDELAGRDPQRALKVASQLQDPSLRAASNAHIAGELSKSDPEQAAQLLKSARDAIAEAKTPRDKLLILVGLAQAQAAMNDKAGAAETLERGFAIGEEMFRKGVDKNPSAPAVSQPGYELMNQLVGVGMRADSNATLTRLDNIRMPALQSLLFVSAAEALDPKSRYRDRGMRFVIEN